MPLLRRHRRDHRARAPKKRKYRNLEKFIPEADSDFAHTAGNFAGYLQLFREDCGLDPEEIATVVKAVAEFRNSLMAYLVAHRMGKRSPQLTTRKNAARHSAECTMRMYANLIRSNPRVDPTKKRLLRIKLRPAKPGKRPCPNSPPRLQFVGSGDGLAGGVGVGSGSGVHVLKFFDYNECVAVTASSEVGKVRRKKPDGAQRVELYFDMVPVGESQPKTPFERGWPKYLRSFTRSPMEVEFPLPSEPMLIVYWAKWADSTGQTSRWSKPCVARVEGWTSTPMAGMAALPESGAMAKARRVETKYVYIHTPIAGELPDQLEGDADASALGRQLLGAQLSRLLDAAR